MKLIFLITTILLLSLVGCQPQPKGEISNEYGYSRNRQSPNRPCRQMDKEGKEAESKKDEREKAKQKNQNY